MPSKTIDVDDYMHVRKKSVSICEPLEIEDHVVQPVTEVSPPKWHLAHTTWFFERFILKAFLTAYKPFSPYFDQLFNSYYKSCGKHWLQSRRGVLSRPTLKEVHDYRLYVDEQMSALLQSETILNNKLIMLTEIGLQHEQQHQELLLMDIKYILATNPMSPVYSKDELVVINKTTEEWVELESGLYQIGATTNNFTYDIEKPVHDVYLPSAKINNHLVTNESYLNFIEDGGYQDPLLWLSDGWDWVNSNQIKAPLYWHQKDSEWFEFTLYGDLSLQKKSPVAHVNYYEANAFAKWSGTRLGTEEELETALKLTETMEHSKTNQVFHPNSARLADNQLWIWTQSAFLPYPGYQAFQGQLGEYNAKFMCNQQVLRGGCFATPSGHYRSTYRNFFMPHQNWMFSGICLAKDM